jgi:cyanophycin synthetase
MVFRARDEQVAAQCTGAGPPAADGGRSTTQPFDVAAAVAQVREQVDDSYSAPAPRPSSRRRPTGASRTSA